MPVTVDLWLTSTEAWLHCQDALTTSLSQSECARRDRLVDPRIGLRFALGRGLLRAVLANRLGIDPAAVEFEIGEAGKPRLAASANLQFNVSASQGRLAIALCTSCEIGVDVECHRTVSDEMLRAPSILSESERTVLAGLPAEARAGTFLRWWTRKEAVAKADGNGVGLGLRKIDAGSPAYAAETRLIHAEGRPFLVCDSDQVDGAYCSVAAATSSQHPQTISIHYGDCAQIVTPWS